MITIDGLSWPIPCKVTRTAEMTASEISGLMLDRSYFNDVIGTFMTYEVELPCPMNQVDAYNAVYEAITDPVDGHNFVLPYNDGSVEITGRVLSVKDTPFLVNDSYYWEGCTFTVIANHPSKYMELGQVLSRGRTPIPGQTVYADADERYY